MEAINSDAESMQRAPAPADDPAPRPPGAPAAPASTGAAVHLLPAAPGAAAGGGGAKWPRSGLLQPVRGPARRCRDPHDHLQRPLGVETAAPVKAPTPLERCAINGRDIYIYIYIHVLYIYTYIYIHIYIYI